MKKLIWIIIIILALFVSLIPWTYLTSVQQGYLELKAETTLNNLFWKTGFYTHIFSGSIAILIGWTQFSKKQLQKKISLHRWIGKVYIVSALFCAFAGIFIGFWAYGGFLAQLGFSIGAILFFVSTLKGFLDIKSGDITHHQNMMRYSYALCLGAINLRLCMPIFMMILKDYDIVYPILAWSWVPNLFIAYWINKTQTNPSISRELISRTN